MIDRDTQVHVYKGGIVEQEITLEEHDTRSIINETPK